MDDNLSEVIGKRPVPRGVILPRWRELMIARFIKLTIFSALISLVFSYMAFANNQDNTEQNKKKKTIATEIPPPIPNVPVESGNYTTVERSREEVKYVNGQREGKTIFWLNDGGRIDGEYIKGLKNGIWIHQDKSGKKIWQESYSKDIRDGMWIWYGASGRKTRQESYKNGRLHGKSLSWAASGAKTADVDFQNGIMHGRQRLWYNGQLFNDWGYVHGKSHGHCISWYSNGQKHFEGNFVEGTGKLKGWYESGKLFNESESRNGKPVGKNFCWYESGAREREINYDENGMKHGFFLHWYESGKPKTEMQYDHGTLLSQKEWDENGTLTYFYSKKDEGKNDQR